MEIACEKFSIDDFQEDRLAKSCLDNASFCALRLDQDGLILYANRKTDLLGYSQEELLKMSDFDIDLNLSRKIWPEAWKKICDDGSVSLESQHRRKDGTLFPIEVTATLIQSEGRLYSMARSGLSKEKAEQLWQRVQNENVFNFESVHRSKDGTDIPVEITAFYLNLTMNYIVSLLLKTYPREKKPKRNNARWKHKCARFRKWSRWEPWPPGSPTISTTFCLLF